jgi:signal transduction histidine kinase
VIVIKGTDEGKQFDLSQPVVEVGRDAGNHIRLFDTEVSRRHAEFHETADGFRVVDVGSANGTFVNSQRITDAPLQPGDLIQIGQSVLLFSSGPGEGANSSDLAERINLIARQDVELSSAILSSIGEAEGSRILARPEQAQGPWLQSALANLGIMYEASQAVSHILDVNQLLDKMLDLIFRSIDADRGCILLRDPDSGKIEPKSVRWRDGNHEEKMAVSRTIVEHVLREREGVLVSDATQDERFNAGQSIVRYGIREVICVPMKGRHETVGVLYLDTRTSARELVTRNETAGKFNPDHLALAGAIGHQAALAIEETRYHQAMVQAERLAAIGQTIAALSHSIKNILQGLRSGGDILKMGLAEKNEALVQQGWKIVEKNQGKIYDLVLDMLSYSKEREPLIEETDLNGVVRDVLELLAGRAKEMGIRVESRLDDKLPSAQADPEGLHRALLNIVGNALDAVEERKHPGVAVTTSLEADGVWARITVLDNGPGIGPEQLRDLFKPFTSSKGAKGTGLGLAVSRKILREHGGDVLVQSQPGKGSKFILRLPLKSPMGADINATRVEQPSLPSDEGSKTA